MSEYMRKRQALIKRMNEALKVYKGLEEDIALLDHRERNKTSGGWGS
jgi:hypothetical protein